MPSPSISSFNSIGLGSVIVNEVVSRTEVSRWTRVSEMMAIDPTAQTFRVTSPDDEKSPGVQLTSMELFFASKDPNLGVTIEIRKTQNGYPAPEVLTFGRKHLRSSQVNTSTDGQTATVITFDAPVFLSNEEEYCFVILPDGNSPDYQIWFSKTGGKDVSTGQPVHTDQFAGSLFMSTNNSAWKYKDCKIFAG